MTVFDLNLTERLLTWLIFSVVNMKLGYVQQKKPTTKVDCTITIEDEDVYAIATGKMSAITAYTQRKLMVSGNLAKAQLLASVLKPTKY